MAFCLVCPDAARVRWSYRSNRHRGPLRSDGTVKPSSPLFYFIRGTAVKRPSAFMAGAYDHFSIWRRCERNGDLSNRSETLAARIAEFWLNSRSHAQLGRAWNEV